MARFITSEAAQSTLKIAEDGHLPELRLRESQGEEKAEARTTTVNPLVLLGALSISVVFSISLALIDFGGDPNADSPRQLRARQLIERDYLPMDKDEPLLPYQRYLGAAQRAHSQGNVKLERALYRRVLDMLREERGDFQKGLTGSRDRDEKLKTWISVLLREG